MECEGGGEGRRRNGMGRQDAYTKMMMKLSGIVIEGIKSVSQPSQGLSIIGTVVIPVPVSAPKDAWIPV